MWRSSLLHLRRQEPAGHCPRAEVLESRNRSGWALLCDGQPCPVRGVGEPGQGGHSTPSRSLRSRKIGPVERNCNARSRDTAGGNRRGCRGGEAKSVECAKMEKHVPLSLLSSGC